MRRGTTQTIVINIGDASALTLTLYAESAPTANFYIKVRGVI